MMAGWLAEDTRPVDDAASFGIVGAEADRFNARKSHGGSTHGAGLKRYPKRASIKAWLA